MTDGTVKRSPSAGKSPKKKLASSTAFMAQTLIVTGKKHP
jgi:hypothetical protein